MALELPSIQTLGSLWNWAKDNIEVWCRAMGSLKDVVSGSDPNQYSTIVAAVQFSFFPVFLSVLIGLPYGAFLSAGKYGPTNVIVDCIVDYLVIVFVACGQKISSILVRGRGSLRASFTLALFGISYLPIMSILTYIVIPSKDEMNLFASFATSEISHNFLELGSKIESRYWIHVLAYTIAFGLFAIFLVIRFVPAIAYIHHVGKVRALIICFLTLLFAAFAIFFVVGPMAGRLLLVALD